MKKITKIFILLFLVITLTGCTQVLKDKNDKPVKNPETGQSITENVLCRPTDENVLGIYEENEIDLTKIPECNKMPIWGKYEGLWTNLFVKPLAFIIVKLGSIVKSAGLALILVTLAIRGILYPITKKTAAQSENMKKAQPELKRIEEKYQDKKDNDSMMKKSNEMMMIYKKYNISPLSGCLFALIQLPLLFAFLEAINRVPAIFEETFLGLQMGTTPGYAISNGNYFYIILIVLILATTYFSFTMNKSMANPEMQSMNKILPIIMIVVIGITSFSLPTAIAVYWIVSSAFTIFQNLMTDRSGKNA